MRVLHWTLAASIGLAWLTTERFVAWHQPLGWLALAIVVVRVAWGVLGRGRARFAAFVRGPVATWRYAALAVRGREPRHVGHNPLGACMVLALMIAVVVAAVSGWLYTTDAYFGDFTVERVHVVAAWTIVGLVVVHVAGVVVASVRHRENLVAAMVHGNKRAPRGSDVG